MSGLTQDMSPRVESNFLKKHSLIKQDNKLVSFNRASLDHENEEFGKGVTHLWVKSHEPHFHI